MAAVVDSDYSIAANGDIRYTGTTTNNTVIEFHRWLQDKADDAVAANDDLLDITNATPSERSTDNIITLNAPYNIDDTLATHLYDGSITQNNGNTIYAGLVVVGAVGAGTDIIIIQNHSVLTDTWSAFPNDDPAANILMRCMVKTRADGVNIDGQRLIIQAREFGDTYAEFSVTMGLGNNTAALFTSSDLNNQTAQGTVAAWGITNTEGYQLLEISGTAPAEPYYSQWNLGVQAKNDLYEFGKNIQRRGTAETIHGINGALFRGVTHEWAYDGIVGAEPATNEIYVWGAYLNLGAITGAYSLSEVVTGGTSGAIGRILSIDTVNTSIVVATQSGTWQSGEVVTGFTSLATATTSAGPVGQATGGGAALILAADSAGADEVWVQLIRGTTPADNAICYEDGDHTRSITVFGSVTARTVSAPFIGASTGTALLGAFGIGLDPTDTSASDLFIDLDGNPITPPNNVTFTVGGLVVGEDRVLVGPENGSGGLDVDQLTLQTSLSGATETAVVVTTAIPTDTPSSGTIRIQLDTGVYRRVAYTSYSGSTFTIASTSFTGVNEATQPRNVFISYIDKLATSTSEAFTSVYLADRTLFIRVRDGAGTPIKTFETTGTLGSAGGSSTAIRTSDS
jgi:hypothetical protein